LVDATKLVSMNYVRDGEENDMNSIEYPYPIVVAVEKGVEFAKNHKMCMPKHPFI
jgi:hypothetical protein